MVYCGEDTIYCYDLSQDKWTTPLPSPPLKYFGLGQVSGKLVTVGGKNRHNEGTNEVYTYEESLRSRRWKQTIPPMPTARWSPSVLSLQSALIVAGGTYSPSSTGQKSTAIVEIFKPDTSQWYRTSGLPTAAHSDIALQLVAIGNTCYTLISTNFDQILYASVDDLLHYAVPAATNQITHIASRDTRSAWKILCNTETYRQSITVLAGNLLAIGGERFFGGKVYSPSAESWIYTSDLPTRLAGAAVAILSSTEILAIGGWIDCHEIVESVSSVYRGTLHLKL